MTEEQFDTKPTRLKRCSCNRGYLEPIFMLDQTTDESWWQFSSHCFSCQKEQHAQSLRADRCAEALLRANIGLIHRDATLSKVKPRIVEQMAHSVYLYGETGVGKTYASVAKFKDDLDKGKDAAFTTVSNLLHRIKATYKSHSTETDGDVIAYYSTVPILYIDDLCADKTTEFVIATLCDIIDNRYTKELKTIITANIAPKNLASSVGDRIASRISGMCDIVEMQGEDRRLNRPRRA